MGVVRNGVPWFDQYHKPVNAKAGCLVQANDHYYLFGEYKTNDENKFIGFSRYVSTDLEHWQYTGLALGPQSSGLLGPNRIGERVKVLAAPAGGYVMLMHTDDLGYTDPHVGLATSPTIDGTFEFQGPLLFNGEPIHMWDLGTFVDDDGTAYLLTHEGNIYQLAPDYRSVVALIVRDIAPREESPAMFRQGNRYFLLTSHKTSWERNDNVYYTAVSLAGPWEKQGVFCPAGTLTYNSQCSFVFMLPTEYGTVPMYLGDRWSFPKQADAATQVWLPITVSGDTITIPEYWEEWETSTVKPVTSSAAATPVAFASATPAEELTIPFTGRRLALGGITNRHSGYARVVLTNERDQPIQDSYVDFYNKVPSTGLRYMAPELVAGCYTLHIIVAGTHGVWQDKAGHIFGSDGDLVQVTGYQIDA